MVGQGSLVAAIKPHKRVNGSANGSSGQTVLEERFGRFQDKLSPSRRKLLRTILENPEDA